jgi:hypothetical protein
MVLLDGAQLARAPRRTAPRLGIPATLWGLWYYLDRGDWVPLAWALSFAALVLRTGGLERRLAEHPQAASAKRLERLRADGGPRQAGRERVAVRLVAGIAVVGLALGVWFRPESVARLRSACAPAGVSGRARRRFYFAGARASRSSTLVLRWNSCGASRVVWASARRRSTSEGRPEEPR